MVASHHSRAARGVERRNVHGVRDDALRQHALVRGVGHKGWADEFGALLLQRLHLLLRRLLLQQHVTCDAVTLRSCM